MEFIEAPIYVKLSDEERDALHRAYVILNDLANAAEEDDFAEKFSNEFTDNMLRSRENV